MAPLDRDLVAALLRQRGDTQIEEISAGTWSQAFGFTSKNERFVIRFGGDAAEYDKDRLAGTWSSASLPVPEVIEVGTAFDRNYAVSRRVDGVPLDTLDAAGWQRTIPSLMESLRALRDLRLPGVGFGSFNGNGDAAHDTWSDWLRAAVTEDGEGRLAGWRDALAAVPGAMARFEAGVERFTELAAACPELRQVAHTDLGAGNTLVSDGRISGIIDWGNAVAGDPLYDIAHLTFWAPWHHGCPERELRRHAADALGDADFDERVRAYELHISLTDQRFNAVMNRTHMIEAVAKRGEQLASP